METKLNLNELGRKIEVQIKSVNDLYAKAQAEGVKLKEWKLQWVEAKLGLKIGCRVVEDTGAEYQVAKIEDIQVGRTLNGSFEFLWRPQLYGYKIKKDGTPGKKKQYICRDEWEVKEEKA